jgi:DivIVA domain-containing protein
MDASQSALDSLRTVEFRETLKGYHRDDVDEYLEKAAVEAEGLQEQLRQSGERLRQAAERISQLETALEQQPAPEQVQPAAVAPDDTLQRTLLLAQKFVDETKADSEAQAAKVLADAEAQAKLVTHQAQTEATRLASESEQRLREDIARLETSRGRLSHEVETMSRHLESERNRLRTALSDILRWVDENVQPTPGADERAPADTDSAPSAPSPGSVLHTGNRPAAGAPAAPPYPGSSGTGPAAGDVTQMRPPGATAMPINTDAPLPLQQPG